MSNNFVVFLTADNCAHCQHTRGKGVLNDGKVLNNVEFLEKVFKYNLEIVNVHYHNMVGRRNNIKEVTKFYKKDKIVFQDRYTQHDGNLRLEVLNAKTKKTVRVFNDFVGKGEKITWSKFLQERIPSKLTHYAFYFPCFLIINRKNWKESIEDEKVDLIAIPNAGITHRDKNGNVGLKKTSESINKRNTDIIKLIEEIHQGKLKMEPMEDDTVEEIKEEKFAPPMESFIEYQGVVVKGA